MDLMVMLYMSGEEHLRSQGLAPAQAHLRAVEEIYESDYCRGLMRRAGLDFNSLTALGEALAFGANHLMRIMDENETKERS